MKSTFKFSILLTALCILFAGSVVGTNYQTNVTYNDTTKLKIKGKKILIIEEDDSTIVKVEKDKKWWQTENTGNDNVQHFNGLYLGITGLRNPQNTLNLNPSTIKLDYAKSFNVNVNLFEKSARIIGEYFKVSTGLGLNMASYRLMDNIELVKTPTGIAEIKNPTVNYRKNDLNTATLTVPILFGISTSQMQDKGFKLAFGGEAGYLFNSNIRRKYDMGNETFKPKVKSDFYLNRFTFSAIARIGINDITFYGQYNLVSLFEKNKGPEIYPFVVGIRLLQF